MRLEEQAPPLGVLAPELQAHEMTPLPCRTPYGQPGECCSTQLTKGMQPEPFQSAIDASHPAALAAFIAMDRGHEAHTHASHH